LGSTTFFPKAPFAELPEVLAQFVGQYYLERESPPEIIVEREFDDMQVLEATLAERSGHKVRITSSVRGMRARWLEMMHNNAARR
jgi:excinuclease ABC subunit C